MYNLLIKIDNLKVIDPVCTDNNHSQAQAVEVELFTVVE